MTRSRGRDAALRVARLFAPHLKAIVDESIPDADLSPYHLEFRGLYRELLDALEDRGETVNPGHLHLIALYLNAAVTLSQMDSTILKLSQDDALANKRSKSFFPLIKQRNEAANDCGRLLFRMGLCGTSRQRAKARTGDLARSLAAGWFKSQERTP